MLVRKREDFYEHSYIMYKNFLTMQDNKSLPANKYMDFVNKTKRLRAKLYIKPAIYAVTT